MNISNKNKDLAVVLFGVIATYLICFTFNIAEEINEALSRYEYIQLDEIPITLFVLAVLSAWFSARRMQESDHETKLRRSAESHLKSSQLLYKSLFDGDLTGNCVVNMDGQILMSNSAFNRICNLPSHLQNLHNLFEFEWQKLLNNLIEAKELNYQKLTVNRTDNSPCFVMARFLYIHTDFELKTKSEIKPKIHVYLVDITEQCLAESELEKTLKENQYLARHAINIQEKERKFIAQEIHDETGQYLTAIRMDALALQKLEPGRILEITSRIASNTGHVQKTIHNLIKLLRPASLDSEGLGGSIKQLVQEWRQHNAITYCEFELALENSLLSEEINIVAFRVVQESLTNISKHANARHVKIKAVITLLEQKPYLIIEVQDNGVGINFKKTSGFGLLGMRERVESLSGNLSVKSEKKFGVCITAKIPLPSTQIVPSTLYKVNMS